ncbi:MBL fold metallo-hydrolase RNA specificity domain-containing protein [Zhouia amylolytica]|uniref:MBL fold metallo-hydrolase RNA specificity domain-containing protein n=1 Tax=Zhouia amylolytica TaxID=376730 RepID=UPI0020CEBAFF|nr:MBL fold metallo-hydrolase [Zhouia amylolytica]MCQ0110013.1 MBL fold metallo-hydrolase [Zhouia amylolytica]
MKTNKVKVHFYGAAQTVTGSKYLIELDDCIVMVDCGLFQGEKLLREENWKDLPFDASSIDYILITHGHLDHVGYLPKIVNQGFQGKILGTEPTLAIAKIILEDSAKIQEEEAEKANEEGYSKHHPALPLYTLEDVGNTLSLFQSQPKNNWINLAEQVSVRFRYNGHILGATFVELVINGKYFVFSGDVGREQDVLLDIPEKPEKADYLFLESTYGDRLHSREPVENKLVDLINSTIYNRGNFIIPSFAVERIQTLLIILWRMYKKNKIPNIPIFVDSPMGDRVLDVFLNYDNWHKINVSEFKAMIHHVNFVSSYRETWEVIDNKQPKIIIAGSGMVTGGRVLTYLQQLIDEENTTILLVGFQAEGTRGRALQEGVKELKFFGKYYPVKAKVESISSLSAHADQNELLNWLSNLEKKPETLFLVHGEEGAMKVLKTEIHKRYQYNVYIPKLYESVSLSIDS